MVTSAGETFEESHPVPFWLLTPESPYGGFMFQRQAVKSVKFAGGCSVGP